jgi:NADH-quinone oxidoreductase subunit H
MLVFLLFTWVRWSFLRIKVDQILAVSWKLMLPLTLALLVVTAVVIVARGPVV